MKCIEEEIPFELPEGWEWCRLPAITIDIFAGGDKPDNYEKNPTPICNIPIYSNGIENNGLYGYTNKPRVVEPSITISARGTIGFCCIRETPFLPIVRLITITPSKIINLYYLKTVFEALIETGEGSSIPQLTVPGIKPKLIPVPPVNEQARIQNKLHEILNSIANISYEKEELQQLLQTIKSKTLDLAIHGKLVPQDPNDEPASVLLERIRAEKEELIKQGKIKRDKNESIIFRGDDNSYYEIIDGKKECINDEIPFELPDNWEWIRLSSVLSLSSGKAIKVRQLTDAGDFPVYGGNGINGMCSEYNVDSNTIIIGRVGYYCGSVYKTETKSWVTDNALIVTIKEPYIFNIDFLVTILKYLDLGKTSVSTAQPVVSGKGILPLIIPVPTQNEQDLINNILQKFNSYISQIESELL